MIEDAQAGRTEVMGSSLDTCPSQASDWGHDSLGQFLDSAQRNVRASFVKLRTQYDALAAID
jgi:hypothetical protein